MTVFKCLCCDSEIPDVLFFCPNCGHEFSFTDAMGAVIEGACRIANEGSQASVAAHVAYDPLNLVRAFADAAVARKAAETLLGQAATILTRWGEMPEDVKDMSLATEALLAAKGALDMTDRICRETEAMINGKILDKWSHVSLHEHADDRLKNPPD
jgi:hypothetical protein